MKKFMQNIKSELSELVQAVNDAADESKIPRLWFWLIAVPLILWMLIALILISAGEVMNSLARSVICILKSRGVK